MQGKEIKAGNTDEHDSSEKPLYLTINGIRKMIDLKINSKSKKKEGLEPFIL